jgi:hypothetical protein
MGKLIDLNKTNSNQHGSNSESLTNHWHLKELLKWLERICSNSGYLQVKGIHLEEFFLIMFHF